MRQSLSMCEAQVLISEGGGEAIIKTVLNQNLLC